MSDVEGTDADPSESAGHEVEPSIDYDQYRRRTRRSLLVGGAATVAGLLGWRWVQTQGTEDNIPKVLRKTHELNESIWSAAFREDHLANTYDRDKASVLRVNGRIGLRSEFDESQWELRVENADGSLLGTNTLEDLRSLDQQEMTIEHKCIEGWSQITNWGGPRFSDLAALYATEGVTNRKYVYMATPDGEYYVNVDMDTMLHPQSLLVHQMLGEPLDLDHGAPLRFATTLKYGIKQIKRIGLIRFTDERVGDYWGERGYDWYAGL
jgi:hypothetical protein